MKSVSAYIVAGVSLLFFTDLIWAQTILIDQLGKRVVVPDHPERVVSLAPSITEVVFALKRGSFLKGATMYSDYPEAAKKLPKVGSYVHLDLERIVALKPDLCIAIKDGNPKEVVQRLEKFGIPVFAVDPRNMETVLMTINQIGVMLDAEEQARLLTNQMKKRIKRVRDLVSTAHRRPKLFFQIGVSPIVSVGTHTFIHELIELAGAENVAQGAVPYPRFSMEQVLGLSPDIIIITSMARGKVFEKVKARWSKWSNLPASRDNNIFITNSDVFDRPTPRLVDGLEHLARLVHPEFFKETK